MGDAGAKEDEDGGEEDHKHRAEDAKGVEEVEAARVGGIGFDTVAVLDGGGDLEVGGVHGIELRRGGVLRGA